MLGGEEPDDKILAVPASDPLHKEYKETADIPKHFLAEVAHFFTVYKDLEGVRVTPMGWEDSKSARECISQAMASYQQQEKGPKGQRT